MSIESIIALVAALGVGGILGVFINKYFEEQNQTKEHDLGKFRESDELLNEQQLSDIVNFELLSNHSLQRDGYSRLRHWEEYFNKISNQFLEKRLINEQKKLLSCMADLTGFIAQHFFTRRGQTSTNPNRYLYPDLNIDYGAPNPQEMAMYEKYARQLEELSKKVQKQYSEYRLAIKKVLKA